MTAQRFARLAASLALAGLLFAACGEDPTSTSAATSATADATSGLAAPAVAGTTAVAAGNPYGGAGATTAAAAAVRTAVPAGSDTDAAATTGPRDAESPAVVTTAMTAPATSAPTATASASAPATAAGPATTPATTGATTAVTAATTPVTTAGTTATTAGTTAAAPTGAATVNLGDTSLGRILVDGRGRTLYLFTNDTPGSGTSVCVEACLAAWPALLTTGAPKAGAGVDDSKLGTITRPDGGTQVTYAGWPLYFFASDRNPADVNGQGLGNAWYAMNADGKAVTR